MSSPRVARVLIDSPLPQLDRLFDYAVPAALDADAQPGVRVKVPLRSAGRVDRRLHRRGGRAGCLGSAALRARDRRLPGPGAHPGALCARPARRRPRGGLGERHPAPGDPEAHGARREGVARRRARRRARGRRRRARRGPTARSADSRPRRGDPAGRAPRRRRAALDRRRWRTGERSARGPCCWPPPRCARSRRDARRSSSSPTIATAPSSRPRWPAGSRPSAVVRDDAQQTSPVRYAAFLRMLAPAPCIVIGNRSAVYAPVTTLGTGRALGRRRPAARRAAQPRRARARRRAAAAGARRLRAAVRRAHPHHRRRAPRRGGVGARGRPRRAARALAWC